MTASVVIPTYNGAPFIREALASVFAQTRLPDEVVVVDDCSPDDTVAVVEAVAATAPVPVRLIRRAKNSGGPALPTNVGVDAARGEWVATLDHDDTFAPTKLADQLRVAEANPDLGLVFGDLTFRGPDAELNRAHEGWFQETVESLPKTPLAGGGFRVASAAAREAVIRSKCFPYTFSNMLFPKAAWRRVGGLDTGTTVSSDLAFLAAVTARADVGYVPAPSAAWLLHPASFYRTGGEYARVRDQLRVYGGLRRAGLSAAARGELRRVVRELAFERAYAERKAGNYRRAAACLWRGMWAAGPWPGAVLELAKLLPQAVVRRV